LRSLMDFDNLYLGFVWLKFSHSLSKMKNNQLKGM
jgi:hypothetical protein